MVLCLLAKSVLVMFIEKQLNSLAASDLAPCLVRTDRAPEGSPSQNTTILSSLFCHQRLLLHCTFLGCRNEVQVDESGSGITASSQPAILGQPYSRSQAGVLMFLSNAGARRHMCHCYWTGLD